MGKKSVPEDEYMTAKDFILLYPDKKGQLEGTVLRKNVSWVLIEREGRPHAQTYFLMTTQAYRNACSAKLDKSSLSDQFRKVLIGARKAEKSVLQLRNWKANLESELKRLRQEVNAEKAALAKERESARSLIIQLTSLAE